MKSLLLSLTVLVSSLQASACLGEAQVIAQVEAYQLVGSTSCFVALSPASIQSYEVNRTCPLDLEEVLHAGIEVGVRREDTCSIMPGETLTGVIVKDVDGTIRLER